jgi:hypothetical protein
VVETRPRIEVRFSAHFAASDLPIMPAVFRIDVVVSAAVIHFAGIDGLHHDAGTVVANCVNFVLCERRAFLVLRVDKKDDERGHKDGHEIIDVVFHAPLNGYG